MVTCNSFIHLGVLAKTAMTSPPHCSRRVVAPSEGRQLVHVLFCLNVGRGWLAEVIDRYGRACLFTGHSHTIYYTSYAPCGVTVSTSAFLACHQCYCAGSSLAWDLNLRALVCGIFCSSSPGVFSGYSGFLPFSIG